MLETLFTYRDREVYLLHEFVIMPDHLHLIITPGPTTTLEKAVQLIKGGSSHRIRKQRNYRMEVWQVGFHDWTIRDYDDWPTKVEYIRSNPVRARLVEKAEEWPYSSATGTFAVDPVATKYLSLISRAKAQPDAPQLPGLKSRPPEEETSEDPSFKAAVSL